MEPPEYVGTKRSLDLYCEQLTLDHMFETGERVKWISLEIPSTVALKLRDLKEDGFRVSHVRRHCISGVKFGECEGQPVEVVGVCLTHPEERGTKFYVDCLFTETEFPYTCTIIRSHVEKAFGETLWSKFGETMWLSRNIEAYES